ncbi:CLUMA_CG009558, isoform A [Clunio marinus]|uniref:CLUMA_CG009558, isoform A n=1 Tax=Clunio marinus TaxID=568069 RepID=A0A1J1I794_9DIPT|nr:CLUMA_CG009558, isoform A [Clunio marinus]
MKNSTHRRNLLISVAIDIYKYGMESTINHSKFVEVLVSERKTLNHCKEGALWMLNYKENCCFVPEKLRFRKAE